MRKTPKPNTVMIPCKCGGQDIRILTTITGRKWYARCNLCGRRADHKYSQHQAALEWNYSRDRE